MFQCVLLTKVKNISVLPKHGGEPLVEIIKSVSTTGHKLTGVSTFLTETLQFQVL